MKNKLIRVLLTIMLVTTFSAFSLGAMGQGILPEMGDQGQELAKQEVLPNGELQIYIAAEAGWSLVDSLGFDRYLRTGGVNLDTVINGDNPVTLRLVKKGGGAAHLDTVTLGGVSPREVKGVPDALNKLAFQDFDVLNLDDWLELEFPPGGSDKRLLVTARIESTSISKVPFQFPVANLGPINSQAEFYYYKLNSNSINPDPQGIFALLSSQPPFFKEPCRPGSGHPAGYVYGWVANDENNLYVVLDVTPDNTMDGDKDYAGVYVKVGSVVKEFKVSLADTSWGTPYFIYTDKAGYQHKVYEFTLPLPEIIGARDTSPLLPLAFSFYGTASPPGFEFSQSEYYIYESEESAEITVKYGAEFVPCYSLLNGESNGDTVQAVVYYRTEDGSAAGNKDYTPVQGSLSFDRWYTGEQSFTVPIIDDNLYEGDESIVLILEDPHWGYLGEISQAILTIIDDDPQMGTIQFSQAEYLVDENDGNASITVTYSGIDYPQFRMANYEENGGSVVSVVYKTSDGTANANTDYTPIQGGLTFNYWEPGEKVFKVPIIDDQKHEADETVLLRLMDPQGAILGKPYQAILIIKDNDRSNGGGSSGGSSTSVQKEEPPDGDLIDRMPGSFSLGEAQNLGKAGKKVSLEYDQQKLAGKKDYYPRVYYWHSKAKKWVALASYPRGDNQIQAQNDGDYQGWFKVFAVKEPVFSDIAGQWAEVVTNRMNGLGMIEGYPAADGGMIRPAKLGDNVTRAEFTAFLFRILNIDPDNQILPALAKDGAAKVLAAKFADTDQIPAWARAEIAAAADAGLLEGRENRCAANVSITRIEAAVMVSRALESFPDYKKGDLSSFKDARDIPDWAKTAVADNLMEGYPDGTLEPNQPITRAEALTVLHKLFVNGMGW